MILRALLKLFIVIPVLFTVKWWYRGLNLFVYIGCGITFGFARISNRLDLLEMGWFKTLTEWVGFTIYMGVHVLWIYSIRELIIKI